MRASKMISFFFDDLTAWRTHIYMFYEAAKHFYPLEKLFLLIFYHRVPPKMTTEKRGFFWPWPIWDARFKNDIIIFP
jgi:hypothetical protein